MKTRRLKHTYGVNILFRFFKSEAEDGLFSVVGFSIKIRLSLMVLSFLFYQLSHSSH